MTLVKPVPQDAQTVAAVEGEIRELVRDELAPNRKPQQRPMIVNNTTNNGDISATDINSLLARAAQPSVKELDSLIATMQGIREQLANEGERIQRAIARYVSSTQATMESVKVIADSVSGWKTPGPTNGQGNHR
jgi:hypothetical protein